MKCCFLVLFVFPRMLSRSLIHLYNNTISDVDVQRIRLVLAVFVARLDGLDWIVGSDIYFGILVPGAN